jgi:cytochrome c oxidase, cbb3-type, ccoQ subunit
MDEIRQLQGYGFFALIVILTAILYGYFYHLYKSEKSGARNYEKYANLALDDELGAKILEKNARE